MIKPIVAYGAPILRKRCQPADITSPELPLLLKDLWDTMRNANGVGLAAPQINIDARVFVVQADEWNVKQAFINPLITAYSETTWLDEEGCLSIPGIQAPVARAEHITISWLDEALEAQTETWHGPVARMIQHEYDHIEGKLYTDRLAPLRKRLLHARLERIRKGKAQCPYPLRYF